MFVCRSKPREVVGWPTVGRNFEKMSSNLLKMGYIAYYEVCIFFFFKKTSGGIVTVVGRPKF